MSNYTNFKIAPKLAQLLGEAYKSIEHALKELIDNAYDADANTVSITLPEIFDENAQIIIKDDGAGMNEDQISSEYLKIASSRYLRHGELSTTKKRKIKGRKGIGKFAGLMVAELMEVRSKANGKEIKLEISKSDLSKHEYDLEKIQLPIDITECNHEEHGTTIILKGLNQNFQYPNPNKLKYILLLEYRKNDDFSIIVNNEKIGIQDYQGINYQENISLKNGHSFKLIYTITEKNVPYAGLIYRVHNKTVGKPINFLKDDDSIPEKLKGRIVGEIICDSLGDFITPDWGAIIDGTILNEEIKEKVRLEIKQSLNKVYRSEIHLANLRYQKSIKKALENLPEYKHEFATQSIQKIIAKFYDEKEEKVNAIIAVMINALEKDYYWNIIQNIQESRDADIEVLAEALEKFGFLEMSIIMNQAFNRLKFLDELDLLIKNEKTLEETMHKTLEKNLWIIGNQYSLMFSNKSLSSLIKGLLDKEYQGDRGNKRPDLFLGTNVNQTYLLIEFKRPSLTIGRDAESQAKKYRDDLCSYFTGKIDILIIGGKVDKNISPHYTDNTIKLLSYTEIISQARTELEWLLNDLSKQ